MADYAPACPHGPLEPINERLFIARGSMRMNPLVRITRNMAIIRHDGDLTLVNPIRLSPEGEKELQALGNIRHILRLGAMHGIDDRWYADQFGAALWAQTGSESWPEPVITHALDDTTELPFPDARIRCFNGTTQPECVLLLADGDGILLTCDAIQNYGDYSHNNWLAKLMMPWIGFPKRMLVGPVWLKVMTPENASLEPDFRTVADLPFDALFSAHGTWMGSGAKTAVIRAVDLAFPA